MQPEAGQRDQELLEREEGTSGRGGGRAGQAAKPGEAAGGLFSEMQNI